MIERVARVLADYAGDGRDYTDVARAAIAAMREPTEGMKEAWTRDFIPWVNEEIEDAHHLYKIMIDAALEEKP